MIDVVIKIGNSNIQHGKKSDRVYLMKLCRGDVSDIIPKLNELAFKNRYTKIFVKVSSEFEKIFLEDGFVIEARIPNFYNGEVDAVFMAKFLLESRGIASDYEIPEPKIEDTKTNFLNPDFDFVVCSPQDAKNISDFYLKVFRTYPFPIDDEDYIKATMSENVEYFSIRQRGKIVALSSSEFDFASQNAEMTDFATLEEYRGKSFASYLLSMMEISAKQKGIKTLYTIARAVSTGMNIVFLKSGYKYCGTLVNNTNIDGAIESMNVLYKSI